MIIKQLEQSDVPKKSFDDHSIAPNVLVSLLCGGIAGVVAKTAVAPIERVKMYFQTSSQHFGLERAFKHGQEIVKSGGLRSLWRGHSTTIIRIAPLAGISFAAHDYAEMELKAALETDRLPIGYKFFAGAIGGATGTFLTYPLDVMRVRFALTPGSNWMTALQRGGLLQGLSPTMLGIIPYSGTAWMLKQTLLERFIIVKNRSPTTMESLIINAIAGLTGQLVTYPLDVVRRRMQMATVNSDGRYLSLKETVKHLIATEGVRGLSKGFTLNIMKGPVVMSLSLTTYDSLLAHYREHSDISVAPHAVAVSM